MDITLDNTERKMNPQMFNLWLFIAGIVMFFAALTSAYIVKKVEGGWATFSLPTTFTLSTIAIVLSSVTMQLALINAKKGNKSLVTTLLSITTILGVVFLTLQLKAWSELPWDLGYENSNPASSFLFILSGAHGFHIITGIVFLLIILGLNIKGRITTQKLSGIRMCNIYWHFLGGVWVYLFIFLSVNHN